MGLDELGDLLRTLGAAGVSRIEIDATGERRLYFREIDEPASGTIPSPPPVESQPWGDLDPHPECLIDESPEQRVTRELMHLGYAAARR